MPAQSRRETTPDFDAAAGFSPSAAALRKTTGLAIAIPAYQASQTIAQVVLQARQVIPAVLVVDDGSSDATARLAEEAGAEVVRLANNEGKGAALRMAFITLLGRGFEAVVTLDADGQHLPEEIPRLLEARGDADLVLGSRDHLFDRMGRVRGWSNRWSSRWISRLAGASLRDAQTGFRLYGRRLLMRTGFPENRFDAESAVLVRAVRGGFRIAQVPIRLGRADGRATSHYRGVVDAWRIARAVVSARWERQPKHGIESRTTRTAMTGTEPL